MSLISTETLSAGDTAVYLRLKLGVRGWRDFLADCLRGRTDLHGQTLNPCGRQRGPHGAWQYIYRMADIRTFVAKVLDAAPSMAAIQPLKPTMLIIDTAKHWRQRKYDQRGAPVARLQTSAIH